ncbi:TOM1-like protein 5 [Rhodamnia argentea]|uniref:TOM1-like protein 5 n=1 Tax=Rhodamnia argentea TaxID=178133 RepID=A0A8B8QW05_9MYRT|nr:TOM1-like protein 5 [Rhodamnia argentea]XP_030551408.1 TOM1-like protein 5 [Rhodamnia argentea]XP_030551410.1 TOM1-like protein 5 [Rhodamnia argentea]XP_030551411.1 TOM1-like protein 5 [Rhodamnia argentea]XP_030551413.1 TOM1-like protein 5 [Rhodamnia argentea]XP_048128724.1 TOM1-like protein 5 [Rhodamnia argentea]
MASELVNTATSNKLTEMDWTKNIEICELVARDSGVSKDIIKTIKKRLQSKHSNAQLYAVMLLEMLMNNIGEPIHKQVIELGILPILVKIVKKKTDLPVRERIFLLLDATQTSLGGASGKFPQYYSAFYDLVSSGVRFPQRSLSLLSDNAPAQVVRRSSGHPTAEANKKSPSGREPASSGQDGFAQQSGTCSVSELSVVQKARNASEVLKDVLDAVDARHPEIAKDEFTLDLVEQCSFQKQQMMRLVMTSRDEKVVSQAIELNEQLQNVLARHDALLLGRSGTPASHVNYKEIEEEEDEQLFRRLRKGKSCVRPEDEEGIVQRPLDLFGSYVPGEIPYRPLILSPSSVVSGESNGQGPPVAIPPPPAKHVERVKFFEENKSDSSGAAGHMRGLSLHSRNASSSLSGSVYSSD